MTAYYLENLAQLAETAGESLKTWYSPYGYAVSAVKKSVDGRAFNFEVVDPASEDFLFSVTLDLSVRDTDTVRFCLTAPSLSGGVSRFCGESLILVVRLAMESDTVELPAPMMFQSP
jgi:hypothetical protein